MKLVRIINCLFLFFALSCVDMSSYVTTLDAANTVKFPNLMQDDKTTSVWLQAKDIIAYFNDPQSQKNLVLTSPFPSAIDVRVHAMALHDNQNKVLQIDINALCQDFAEQTTNALHSILRDYGLAKNIFFVHDSECKHVDWRVFNSHRVLIGATPGAMRHAAKYSKPVEFMPLSELKSYAKKLMPTLAVDKSEETALLLFAFLPGIDLFHAVDVVLPEVERGTAVVDAVYHYFQKVTAAKQNNFHLKEEMKKFASEAAYRKPDFGNRERDNYWSIKEDDRDYALSSILKWRPWKTEN